MNRNEKSQPAGAGNGYATADAVRETPSTDMQPEDAGTADSGNEGGAGRTSEAGRPTEQAGKAPAERQR